jgi:hypothetical protein
LWSKSTARLRCSSITSILMTTQVVKNSHSKPLP